MLGATVLAGPEHVAIQRELRRAPDRPAIGVASIA